MRKQGTLLIVDDNKAILTASEMLLTPHFHKIITLISPKTLIHTLEKEDVDVVLMDMNFTSGINNGNEGIFWLTEVKKHFSTLEVVLFTSYADIDLAVKGMKLGAIDFVVKPWDNDKLVATLRAAYEQRKNKRKTNNPNFANSATPHTHTNPPSMYWGTSAQMQQLKAFITKVAQTDAHVLITGENGTGKELLAKEIHRLSSRAHESLITVDMGAITETLFESELFGHSKGAFTDAHSERIGKFELANHGTLFLDEIGNLSFHLQAKLLTAIQSKSIVKVGSNIPVPVNIRLICATNKNLQAMVTKEEFREDLLYRINTIPIEIPPLRDRKEDIIPLAQLFLDKFTTLYQKPAMSIPSETAKLLKEYSWQGNIRELEHAIEKAVIINEGSKLEASAFNLSASSSQTTKSLANLKLSTLDDMEKQMILEAIDQHEGNLSVVASKLGISRQTLYNKMKKFAI